MKKKLKILKLSIILILCSFQLIGQQIKLQKKNNNYYYIVPYSKMKIIDYKLRKFEILNKNKNYTLKLLNQIRLAKIVSDSFSLSLQKNILKLKEENIKLKKNQKNQVNLNLKYKKLQKKLLFIKIRDYSIISFIIFLTINFYLFPK